MGDGARPPVTQFIKPFFRVPKRVRKFLLMKRLGKKKETYQNPKSHANCLVQKKERKYYNK